jgi:hypothetical protein
VSDDEDLSAALASREGAQLAKDRYQVTVPARIGHKRERTATVMTPSGDRAWHQYNRHRIRVCGQPETGCNDHDCHGGVKAPPVRTSLVDENECRDDRHPYEAGHAGDEHHHHCGTAATDAVEAVGDPLRDRSSCRPQARSVTRRSANRSEPALLRSQGIETREDDGSTEDAYLRWPWHPEPHIDEVGCHANHAPHRQVSGNEEHSVDQPEIATW